MKKLFMATSLLLLICITFCACADNKSTTQPEKIVVTTSLDGKDAIVGNKLPSFPLVSQPTSLNILYCGRENVNTEDIYVWKKYEQMTGVNVNWDTVLSAERKAKVEIELINKSQIDLIMRCKISATRLSNYGAGGYILDLNKDGMLEKYAPNCWAFLQSHPETLASITTPDGKIYSLPQVNSGAELRVSRKIFVNKLWLERANMELPSTTEEFYQLLKAFKEGDANGNGNADDEIPFCPVDWASVQESFYGSFGLANRGVHNMTVDFDGRRFPRYIASSDDYKTFLEYFNTLWDEGLIDADVFNDNNNWKTKAANDLIGVFASTNLATVPADKLDNWVAIDEALEGPNGDKLFSAVRANFHSEGAAVIPSTCKNPQLVLQWLDYFWTDEGTLFYHMGVEGETFEVKEDGSYDYMPYIYERMTDENKSFDEIIAQYSPYPGGSNPTVEIAPYFMGGEMADVPATAARSLIEYGPEEYWPSFTFTADEIMQMDPARDRLAEYCTDNTFAFIKGEKELSDAEWEAYQNELTSLGLADVLTCYKAAMDRYYAANPKT